MAEEYNSDLDRFTPNEAAIPGVYNPITGEYDEPHPLQLQRQERPVARRVDPHELTFVSGAAIGLNKDKVIVKKVVQDANALEDEPSSRIDYHEARVHEDGSIVVGPPIASKEEGDLTINDRDYRREWMENQIREKAPQLGSEEESIPVEGLYDPKGYMEQKHAQQSQVASQFLSERAQQDEEARKREKIDRELEALRKQTLEEEAQKPGFLKSFTKKIFGS